MGFRRDRITRPIHKWAKGVLPGLSQTESDAINAGEVWWEAELFSGDPDWSKLHDVAAPKLTAEEQAFLDGPMRAFCDMVDDWKVNHETGDLAPEAWDFLRENKFFGMILPKEYGGLGFSAFAHSEVVRFISSHSVAAAVTVMVPNSLGPGELLLQFGTQAQKDDWLPRLADGRELPAFGLTSEDAGSDASAMTDHGVVCKGQWNGEEVTGIRLNWSKRYITLAPVCTVLGLAFKLSDPDRLLGSEEDIGITCALVPTDLPGVTTGHRHIPAGTMFMNGPTQGHDVFVPLDHIIGGPEHAGHGWMMLMSALAAGRGISLPSQSAAACASAAQTTGEYARIREQFRVPIGLFEGVQERMGELAATAYELDAARRLTCAGLDEGRKLAVISAIMKYHATTRMRRSINDAMDVHSGKAVIDGPLNYIGQGYKSVPIGITVEGANIVTRNLIIFGQGSIRAHPHLLDEMLALQEPDRENSLTEFDRHFWKHVGHSTRTFFRALGRAWTDGRIASAPENAGPTARYYRKMARWSAAFALTADFAFLTMGGALKRKEMLSARMGDVLSELYFMSATLKRWQDEGRQEADLPLVHYSCQAALHRIAIAMNEVISNFPAGWASGLLRSVVLPGGGERGPSDKLTSKCAMLIYAPSATRDRVTAGLYRPGPETGLGLLHAAYEQVIATEGLSKRLREVKMSPEEAHAAGVLSESDYARVKETEAAVRRVIAVDDFSPQEIGNLFPNYTVGRPRPETKEAAE